MNDPDRRRESSSSAEPVRDRDPGSAGVTRRTGEGDRAGESFAAQRTARYDPGVRIVLDWNGIDVPEELRRLPKGRYEIVGVDEAPELTDEEDAGLEAALSSVRDGRAVPIDDARRRVAERLTR